MAEAQRLQRSGTRDVELLKVDRYLTAERQWYIYARTQESSCKSSAHCGSRDAVVLLLCPLQWR